MALIAPNHIQSRSGQIIGLESAVQQGAESGKYLATKGQVLYSKIRPALMKAAIAPVSCLCSADMYAIDGEEEWVSNAYLLEYLLSPEFENYAVTMSDRVAMPKLNRDTLNAAPISLPPLRLQGDIAARNQRNRSDVDNLVTEIETLIQLALERRAALITAVVTGQIDVTAKHKPAAEQLEDDVAQGLHREYA
nr:restriction endonuclease subunit S [Kocuria indica]